MKLESLDWEVLDRLRETFLSDAKAAGPYWHTITDLECYMVEANGARFSCILGINRTEATERST